jgi:hypothetical protein
MFGFYRVDFSIASSSDLASTISTEEICALLVKQQRTRTRSRIAVLLENRESGLLLEHVAIRWNRSGEARAAGAFDA